MIKIDRLGTLQKFLETLKKFKFSQKTAVFKNIPFHCRQQRCSIILSNPRGNYLTMEVKKIEQETNSLKTLQNQVLF